jgi:predicted DNA-binding transcriptional regulator AlpA
MRQSTLKYVDKVESAEVDMPAARRGPKTKEQVNASEEKARPPIEGYMRLPAVLSLFPVSRSTWWAGISAGRFPKGVKLGPRITAWKVEDIRKLIESPEAA